MKALDTNVLIRFLVKDNEQQAEAVYNLFKLTESQNGEFWVQILVLLETLWVLEAAYKISREEIIDSIDDLLRMPILKFEAHSAIQSFLLSARKCKIDLSDLLIAHSSKLAGCEKIITFDKKASNFELFELLNQE